MAADFDIYLAYQRNVQDVSFNVIWWPSTDDHRAKVPPPLAAIMALTELIEKSSGAMLLAYVAPFGS